MLLKPEVKETVTKGFYDKLYCNLDVPDIQKEIFINNYLTFVEDLIQYDSYEWLPDQKGNFHNYNIDDKGAYIEPIPQEQRIISLVNFILMQDDLELSIKPKEVKETVN